MKTVQIETINNKQYTVIWHLTQDMNWRTNWWLNDKTKLKKEVIRNKHGFFLVCGNVLVATALFALPKHPKPYDNKVMELLHRHESEGLTIHGIDLMRFERRKKANGDRSHSMVSTSASVFESMFVSMRNKGARIEITHCTLDGKRVEIAIDGGGDA